LEKCAHVWIHDPYVNAEDQNLKRLGLTEHFTNDLVEATREAEVVIACTGHIDYVRGLQAIRQSSPKLLSVVDACNLWSQSDFGEAVRYTGIGRGTRAPGKDLVEFVTQGFSVVEHAFARELNDTIEFLNNRYAHDSFNRVGYRQVQKLAGTCSTGCHLAEPIPTEPVEPLHGFLSTLVELASTRTVSAQA
jgi:hypothetical protein